jgi:uncharacterized protein (TIGR00297 family)
MTPLENLVVVLALCSVLSYLSYRTGMLTASGSITSFFIGLAIGGLGSYRWLLLLIAFTILGFIVTQYKINVKMRNGLQEGKKGERTYKNVLANGLVPALVAVAAFTTGSQEELIAGVAFISSLSVAASDTVASEMGVLSDRVKLITTWESVAPGTDGGVSVLGTVWALLGAIFAGLIGWMIIFYEGPFGASMLIPMVMGFVGCLLDSVIGATLERAGKVSKLGNNMLTMAIGSALGALIFTLL